MSNNTGKWKRLKRIKGTKVECKFGLPWKFEGTREEGIKGTKVECKLKRGGHEVASPERIKGTKVECK